MNNPHFERAQKGSSTELKQVEATLAFAYEARTANLLAAYAADIGSSSPLYNEIHDRLGLGDTK